MIKPIVKSFKHQADRPLMLWCASHSTLAQEEIPLFLEAGFRVVPLLTDMWTFEHRAELEKVMGDQWKASVGLPHDVVRQLQALRLYDNWAKDGIAAEDLRLLNEHVDIVYATVNPNVPSALLRRGFEGTAIFRPFGHGTLNTYSRVMQWLERDFSHLAASGRYIWCPIVRSLQEPEDSRICVNPVLLRCFVSPERLSGYSWAGEASEPTIADTIPRINKQPYYREIFDRYVCDFPDLPMKIFGGGNELSGGEIADPRIVGTLSDDDYFGGICRIRLSIYHGRTPYHVHYHPYEYMTLGVPVLFHQDSAIAAELFSLGLNQEQCRAMGMYLDAVDATAQARIALADVSFAIALSQRQQFIRDNVCCRRKALDEARWLKTVCVSQLCNAPAVESRSPPVQETKASLSLPVIMNREFKRFARQLKTLVKKAA